MAIFHAHRMIQQPVTAQLMFLSLEFWSPYFHDQGPLPGTLCVVDEFGNSVPGDPHFYGWDEASAYNQAAH